MDRLGKVVREGRWIYADAIEVAVRVHESGVRHGSGDDDDPPDIREDSVVRCFYVAWDAAGTSRSSSVIGPFNTQAAAEAFAVQQSGASLRWLS